MVSADEHINQLKTKLIQSHWPNCINIAKELVVIGSDEAKQALLEALTAKRHHIRTASVEALANLNDPSIVPQIKPLLSDPAYETRMAAKSAIEHLTGEKVLTARGE